MDIKPAIHYQGNHILGYLCNKPLKLVGQGVSSSQKFGIKLRDLSFPKYWVKYQNVKIDSEITI